MTPMQMPMHMKMQMPGMQLAGMPMSGMPMYMMQPSSAPAGVGAMPDAWSGVVPGPYMDAQAAAALAAAGHGAHGLVAAPGMPGVPANTMHAAYKRGAVDMTSPYTMTVSMGAPGPTSRGLQL